MRAPEERRKRLQSFGQAAVSASWSSDNKDRGGGSRGSVPESATSRTSRETGVNETVKPGEQEATSPLAKNKPVPGRNKVSEIANKLFSTDPEMPEKYVRKRKPESRAGSKGDGAAKGKLSAAPLQGSDLSLVVVGKGLVGGPSPPLTGLDKDEELTKKHKNDQFCFQCQGNQKGVGRDQVATSTDAGLPIQPCSKQ